MDRWSGLERMLLLLLSHLIGSYQKAEVAFYSANSIKSHTDMITGLIILEKPQQSSQWRKLCDKCLKASNSRNHLVHGQWVPEYRVGADELNRPTVTKLEWRRVYMTGNPELNAQKAMQSGKPKTGGHQYSLERIRQNIEQVVALSHEINEFRTAIFGEALPLK
jgi:hypothetical protein